MYKEIERNNITPGAPLTFGFTWLLNMKEFVEVWEVRESA
jgi:hypothetical protein